MAASVREPVIDVRGLVYTYPRSERPAVSGVSFEVHRGEVFGLLGPSGAGKSTIQKILTRQHRRVTSGDVKVFGRSIGDWGQQFYERIGVGFELPNHYLRMTARENLRFFASLYAGATRDPMELLAMVSLANAADVRVGEFSKGMMMRLNFVRALLHDPELLFFDEPTSGLDPTNARLVKKIIRAQQSMGKTIILTTHNMTDVEELCGRVGFMVKGEMKTLGSVPELSARYGERVVRVERQLGDRTDVDNFPLDGLADNAKFLAALRGDVRTIHSQEASLDAVFTKVTGATLNAEEDVVS